MTRRYWRLVSLVTGWHVVASVCYYAVFAGSTFLREAFTLSSASVGLIITSLSLGYAVFLLPLGAATDRYGERRTLTGGLVGLSLGVVAVALAPTYGLLLVAAFGLGSAYGVATPGTNRAVFDNVVPARQHRAIGLKQTGPPLGSAVGSVLVTGLAETHDWQAGFLVAGGLGVVAALLFARWYAGVATTQAPGEAGGGASGDREPGETDASGMSGASKPTEESKSADDGVPGLLANRPFLLLLVAGSCLGAVFYTTTGYTVLYVEDALGTTVAAAGLVLALLQVAGGAGRVVAGWLGDVLPGASRDRLAGLLSVQLFAGAVLFLAIPLATAPVEATVVFALLGLFALGSSGLYYSFLSVLVPDDAIGSASAAGQLAATTGGLFGPPVFGWLVDAVGYGAGWGYLGALSFVAVCVVVAVFLLSR